MADEDLRQDDSYKPVLGGLTRGDEIRNVRVTETGELIMAREAPNLPPELDAQVDSGGVTVTVDVSAWDKKLIVIENQMDQDVDIDVFGSGNTAFHEIQSGITIPSFTTFAMTITDPWLSLDIDLVGPVTPTGGNVIVEVLRQ